MAPKSGDFGYFSDCKMWRKNMNDDDDSYLKRLPPEYYRGQACVHWSLTIQDRKQGWLKPVLPGIDSENS
jgi:hypothetical protein